MILLWLPQRGIWLWYILLFNASLVVLSVPTLSFKYSGIGIEPYSFVCMMIQVVPLLVSKSGQLLLRANSTI